MCVVFTFSEAGGHVTNEDAFAVQAHPSDPDCWLCLLADGQGGHAGGAAAAQLACRAALQRALDLPAAALARPGTWVSLLRAADLTVEADPEAGYCTLVGLAIAGNLLAGASSGDSAAWFITSGGRMHDLTGRQRKNPPVGSGAAVFVPFVAGLQEPWRVLVMSDGVWKYVGRDRAHELAQASHGRPREPHLG
jgi:serine/threonine protein phosphatase PrpC